MNYVLLIINYNTNAVHRQVSNTYSIAYCMALAGSFAMEQFATRSGAVRSAIAHHGSYFDMFNEGCVIICTEQDEHKYNSKP